MSKFSRREFMSVLAGASAAVALSPAPIFAQTGRRKKNVLFVAVDDLRPQLNCYGQKQIISPCTRFLIQVIRW